MRTCSPFPREKWGLKVRRGDARDLRVTGWLARVVLLAWLVVGSAPGLIAQDAIRSDSEDLVRSTAERILASPDFRYFKRLDDRSDDARRDSPDGSRSWLSKWFPQFNWTPDGGTPSSDSDRPSRDSRHSREAGKPSKEEGGRRSRRVAPQGTRTPPGPDAEGDSARSQAPLRTPWFRGGNVLAHLAGNTMQVLAYVVVSLVCVAIVVFAIRGAFALGWFRRHPALERGSDQISIEAPDLASMANVPADQCFARANDLAYRGELREALAQLLIGAMGSIERAGWIEHRRGLTPRDYLRAARKQGAAGSAFHRLLWAYEPVGFGRRPALRHVFDEAVVVYRENFLAGVPREGAPLPAPRTGP